MPVSYKKTWPDGQATPGICLLTLFKKKKDLDHDTFLERWHKGHTPLSLKIHPLWHYNRNVVKKYYGIAGRSFDGIVEEHFQTPSDLLNPLRFFGGPFSMVWNMWAVYKDVNSFIEYNTIEPYYCKEVHVRSPK